MADGSISRKLRVCGVLVLAAVGCMFSAESVRAQAAALPIEADELPPGAVDEPVQRQSSQWSNQPVQPPTTIGGAPEPARTEYYYNSPLKKIGSDLLFGGYALSVIVSVAYLAVVYPLQALFGSNKVEPVMLWMLLPIAGPWFAQYEDSVRSKPFWRVVLIGDSVLQASGIVVGLIGLALSGTRKLEAQSASRIRLNLGVAGAGPTGVTLSAIW
jgi:hypothetical protein